MNIKPKKHQFCWQQKCTSVVVDKKSDDYYNKNYCKEHGDYHRNILKEMKERVAPVLSKFFNQMVNR